MFVMVISRSDPDKVISLNVSKAHWDAIFVPVGVSVNVFATVALGTNVFVGINVRIFVLVGVAVVVKVKLGVIVLVTMFVPVFDGSNIPVGVKLGVGVWLEDGEGTPEDIAPMVCVGVKVTVKR